MTSGYIDLNFLRECVRKDAIQNIILQIAELMYRTIQNTKRQKTCMTQNHQIKKRYVEKSTFLQKIISTIEIQPKKKLSIKLYWLKGHSNIEVNNQDNTDAKNEVKNGADYTRRRITSQDDKVYFKSRFFNLQKQCENRN